MDIVWEKSNWKWNRGDFEYFTKYHENSYFTGEVFDNGNFIFKFSFENLDELTISNKATNKEEAKKEILIIINKFKNLFN